MSDYKIIGCIPARYASSRLPGKPLCDIAGKPMIVHVAELASQAKQLDDVVVLTDDQRIIDAVSEHGFKAIMTSEQCASGTDRIAEYMQQSDADVFVNIQGDEVTLNPEHMDALVTAFISSDNPQMGTLAHTCSDKDTLAKASNVKVVTATNNTAMYFSRSPIPVTQSGEIKTPALIHIGAYIYSRETLTRLMQLEQSPLESTESLEQLRALENGIEIKVAVLDNYEGLAVDTEEDLELARQRLG